MIIDDFVWLDVESVKQLLEGSDFILNDSSKRRDIDCFLCSIWLLVLLLASTTLDGHQPLSTFLGDTKLKGLSRLHGLHSKYILL